MDFCTTPTSLSLQDLITAPAKAESLLELLTPDQISAIEKTLGKVKKRRLIKEEEEITIINKSNITPPITTTSITTTTTTTTAKMTPPTPTTTTTTTTTTTPTPQSIVKPANNNTNNTPNEPVTEVRDGIEWVSFVYSHNRTLKRYSIRTDLLQVDTSLIDDKFKSENCVCIQ
jgi:hypothetical protein